MISSRMPAALALFVLVLHAATADARGARGHWVHPGPDQDVHVSTNPKAVAREFGGWLDQIEQSGQISGMAVAIVKDDTVLLQRGIGYADASRGLKVQLDSPFRLASLS
ncbi:MAG: serine hydrolase, partial [Rudaea sp.]